MAMERWISVQVRRGNEPAARMGQTLKELYGDVELSETNIVQTQTSENTEHNQATDTNPTSDLISQRLGPLPERNPVLTMELAVESRIPASSLPNELPAESLLRGRRIARKLPEPTQEWEKFTKNLTPQVRGSLIRSIGLAVRAIHSNNRREGLEHRVVTVEDLRKLERLIEENDGSFPFETRSVAFVASVFENSTS